MFFGGSLWFTFWRFDVLPGSGARGVAKPGSTVLSQEKSGHQKCPVGNLGIWDCSWMFKFWFLQVVLVLQVLCEVLVSRLSAEHIEAMQRTRPFTQQRIYGALSAHWVILSRLKGPWYWFKELAKILYSQVLSRLCRISPNALAISSPQVWIPAGPAVCTSRWVSWTNGTCLSSTGGPVRVGHTIPAGMGFIVIVLMIIFGGAAPSTCLFQETFTGILQ